jgi:hypothetical protein
VRVEWLKTGAVFEDDYFALGIKAVDRALEIVNRFNELNIVWRTLVELPDGEGSWGGTRVATYDR